MDFGGVTRFSLVLQGRGSNRWMNLIVNKPFPAHLAYKELIPVSPWACTQFSQMGQRGSRRFMRLGPWAWKIIHLGRMARTCVQDSGFHCLVTSADVIT